MTELSANIRLRPIRIGFLVRPSDRKSVREIMRINACLWGGIYNPIIPVFRNTPKEWKDKWHFAESGQDVTRGYIRFFEPDVYVEAQEGLLEKAGLGALRKRHRNESVATMEQFFENEYRGLHSPKFGQSVNDIMNEIFRLERRFKLRDHIPAIYPKVPGDPFSEACIGTFPVNNRTDYFQANYRDVYRPTIEKSSPELWLKIFGDNCETPFSVTNRYFESWRSWHDDPVIYIFDPKATVDLIDLWNMRIEPSQLFPVPMAWIPDLIGSLRKFIENNHRPVKGNDNGIMHATTVEVSRSISDEYFQDNVKPLFKDLPQGSWGYKEWRTSIWQINYDESLVMHPERIKLSAIEKRDTLPIKKEGYYRTEFESLSPEFAEMYSGNQRRWVNVLTLSGYNDCDAALSLPYNTFDHDWPFRGEYSEFRISREGWVFCQDHKDSTQTVKLLRNDEAFTKWFEIKGVQVSLSDAGRIARQMLESLSGFWGLVLFDNKESVQFVNKLANSSRIRNNADGEEVLEENFTGRAATIDEWQKMIARRNAQEEYNRVKLSDYIEKNVIRVGLETECSHCNADNWHDLDDVSYKVKCSRCLKTYDFPQGNLKKYNQNWKYRVIGPFAIPNYAQGAYASLLTIRFFSKFCGRDNSHSFSTAIDVVSNDNKCEVDFAIWLSDERGYESYGEPKLLIGEAKSYAFEAIKEDDLSKLKIAASLMPDSILVISVLKTEFSDNEVDLLKGFVEWAREPVNYNPRHWVILLTGTELNSEFLESTWRKKGEPYNKFLDYHDTRGFYSLSDSTLAIYLGLPSYYEWTKEKRKVKKL